MAGGPQRRASPPYASFTTLRNLLDRMERDGPPSRVDNTYLVGMAGGTQGQVKHALRSLHLIDEEGRPTEDLKALVADTSHRRQRLARILTDRFPDLVGLPADATRGQLDEALGSFGLSGATLRRPQASSCTPASTPECR